MSGADCPASLGAGAGCQFRAKVSAAGAVPGGSRGQWREKAKVPPAHWEVEDLPQIRCGKKQSDLVCRMPPTFHSDLTKFCRAQVRNLQRWDATKETFFPRLLANSCL